MDFKVSVLSFLVLGTAALFYLAEGHGRFLQPISRASAWREFPDAPANYDDNGLNCGGFANQWDVHDGKCGMCGDPYQGPREHEAGGKYAQGIITEVYQEAETITLHVQITAYHQGWFEFRLCVNNDFETPITQECLDENLLVLEDQQGNLVTRYDINEDEQYDYYIKARLPQGVVCETQCVMQWKYNAGNSWGTDPDTGESCVGCGPQEQFYGCSDVQIVPSEPQPTTRRLPTITTTTRRLPTTTTTRRLSTTTTTRRLPTTTTTRRLPTTTTTRRLPTTTTTTRRLPTTTTTRRRLSTTTTMPTTRRQCELVCH